MAVATKACELAGIQCEMVEIATLAERIPKLLDNSVHILFASGFEAMPTPAAACATPGSLLSAAYACMRHHRRQSCLPCALHSC